ncbi:hypothetical protein DM02DRAFT_114535 [Periconia macrospinosa]|uniref:Uncharacterized protein n=1 Tax=Periconia macrospinosa TaxID=97972 RepID=A0A2V1DHF0_9PLEO|nr:hypothetical protein DM02DRAFT_114535 [Periconia macrospinosa]
MQCHIFSFNLYLKDYVPLKSSTYQTSVSVLPSMYPEKKKNLKAHSYIPSHLILFHSVTQSPAFNSQKKNPPPLQNKLKKKGPSKPEKKKEKRKFTTQYTITNANRKKKKTKRNNPRV